MPLFRRLLILLFPSLDSSLFRLSLRDFVLISVEIEDTDGADSHDREDDKAGSSGSAVVVGVVETLIVDEHCSGDGGVVWTALVENLRNIEHVQTTDKAGDQGVEHDGLDIGKSDAEEGLSAVGTVNFRSLKDFGVNAENTGDENDGGVTIPHPELNECNDTAHPSLALEEVDSLAAVNSGGLDDVIDRTNRETEQSTEEDSNSSSGYNVGQIEENLKETLTTDLAAGRSEPCSQNEGEGQLRNKVHQPDSYGVVDRSLEGFVAKNVNKVLEGIILEEFPGDVAQTLTVGETKQSSIASASEASMASFAEQPAAVVSSRTAARDRAMLLKVLFFIIEYLLKSFNDAGCFLSLTTI